MNKVDYCAALMLLAGQVEGQPACENFSLWWQLMKGGAV